MRVVLVCACLVALSFCLNNSWGTLLTNDPPSPRCGHVMGATYTDTTLTEVSVLFVLGGMSSGNEVLASAAYLDMQDGEEQWAALTYPAYAVRAYASAVSVGTGMYLFGGFNSDMEFTDDLYYVELADPANPVWTIIHHGLVWPEARAKASLSLSEDGTQAILLGGETEGGVVLDTWRFNLAQALTSAVLVAPTGSYSDWPCARAGHVAEYVTQADQTYVMLQGGTGSNGRALSDVWQLHLGISPQWEEVTHTIGGSAYPATT
ncbi:hypothetical protein KIPB_013400, partial [Kipferlia bialata]|eukprot:g13400.t1